MLPVYLDLSRKTIRAINNRIDDILDLIFDLYNFPNFDIEDISFLFPNHLVVENPDYCIKALKTLRTIVQDNFIRNSLDPIYEYILFQVLHYEIDLLKDEGELKDNLYDEYFDEEGNEIKDIPEEIYVKDIEGYLDFMFEDYDFLTVSEGLISELEEYQILMPEDIRRKIKLQLREFKNNPEEIILQNIIYALKQIEAQPTLYEKCSETQINDHIYSIINKLLNEKEIIVEREKLHGHALKTIGEVDFYFYNKNSLEGICIGESKNCSLFNKTIKQLLGYMNQNIRFGLTISINKNSNLSIVKSNIINSLKTFNYNDYKLEEIQEFDDFIVTTHKIPEKENSTHTIYHLFLNLNTEKRKEIAKIARKK